MNYRIYGLYRRFVVPVLAGFSLAWHLAWVVKCAIWGPRKVVPPPMTALEREHLDEVAMNAGRWWER